MEDFMKWNRNLLWIATVLCVGCGGDSRNIPARPTSDFDTTLTSPSTDFYSDGFIFALNGHETGGGYANVHLLNYGWDDDSRGGVVGSMRGTHLSFGFPDAENDNGEIRVSLDAAALDGTIAEALDLVFHPDGTVTGTITGEGFGDPYGSAPSPAEVVVDGVWSLDCLNAGSPAELDLADGSMATFDCESGVPSYTIESGE